MSHPVSRGSLVWAKLYWVILLYHQFVGLSLHYCFRYVLHVSRVINRTIINGSLSAWWSERKETHPAEKNTYS